ncbi:MAG: PIN domain-containing protein [Burkholderiaceae bacterium]|nr:PIN domain-containing protein [Burkholderiaceae bacterium]MDH3459851.1 PIN domain-containing protein [Burkholderiaceae bacterium]
MRIFLDANILFSAAKSDGAVRELLACAYARGHTLCVDDYVVAEALRNLVVKGLDALTTLDALLSRLEVTPLRATELPPGVSALLPEKDRPVLAAAIRLECLALVTGDRRHFGVLYGECIGGVTIYSPRALAEALLTTPNV